MKPDEETDSKIGEIVETESRPETESKPETEKHSRRNVASLHQFGDGVVHCHVQQKIHQEWLHEFCDSVSDEAIFNKLFPLLFSNFLLCLVI